MVSGGLSSFEAARRVLEKWGPESLHLWFADTRMEDEDLYRFLADMEAVLHFPVERMADGRTPWEVFADERFLGNSRIDPCSKNLKREMLRAELRRRFTDTRVTVFLGLDWTEPHRINAAKGFWARDGYEVGFPLDEEPYLLPQDLLAIVRAHGIEPPRLYALGFPHNNCGGACVKAGVSQWAHLLQVLPERYRWHEEQEQWLRRHLRKNVSILEDRRGGRRRPMTLRLLRWRFDNGLIDLRPMKGSLGIPLDNGWACTCFIPASVEAAAEA